MSFLVCDFSLLNNTILTSKWILDAVALLRLIFFHRLIHSRTFSFRDPNDWLHSSFMATFAGAVLVASVSGSLIVGRLWRLSCRTTKGRDKRDLEFFARSRSPTVGSASVALETFFEAFDSHQFWFSRFTNQFGFFSNAGSIFVISARPRWNLK